MNGCCQSAVVKKPNRRMETVGWIGTVALYFAIPKCPACLAMHVAVWTGLGISFGAAEYLRWGLITACGIAAAILAFRVVRRHEITT